MKHATPQTLTAIEPVLKPLHADTRLKERTPGYFHRKSAGLLRFHGDPAGLLADLMIAAALRRFPDNAALKQNALLVGVARELDRAKALP